MDVSKFFIYTLVIDLAVAQWSAVGRSQSFQCDAPIENLISFSWKKGELLLYNCDFENMECVTANEAVTRPYETNITSNSTSSRSIFTIMAVEPLQHNTIWSCEVFSKFGLNNSKTYKLNIFAAASNPTCENVTLFDSNTIVIPCLTEKVFPDAVCLFYITANETGGVRLINGTTNYTTQPSTYNDYRKVYCTYTVTANILKFGSNAFFVEMYPNISLEITDQIKRSSNTTVPITIDYPKAVLDPGCHVNEVIKENSIITCTCYNNKTSFLPTYAKWSKNGSENGTLVFTARRPSSINRNIFLCEISNVLNYNDTIQYQPIVAYPPDIIHFDLFQHVMDACDNKNVDTLGNCTVSESYPEAKLFIYINNTLFSSKKLVNSSEYIFSVPFNSTGTFNVTCYANNDVFLNTSATMSQTAIVKGPPDFPKILHTVNGTYILPSGNKLTVAQGKTTIMCLSSGGFPNSKNLTLVCQDGVFSTTNSETVTLTLNITSSMTLDEITCTCNVVHESACNLQNKSTVQLIFPPDIVNFTLLRRELDMCDDKKVDTVGFCSVSKTYPEPTVFIYINNTLVESKTEINTTEYRFNISMNSTGIFKVSCIANSSAFFNPASSISQYAKVKGPPEPPMIVRLENITRFVQSNDILQVKKGETTIMCISNSGYPSSKNLSLVCHDQEKNATNQETVTLKLNITSSMTLDELKCTCIVFHESKCYLQNKSTVYLKISDLFQDHDFQSIYIGVSVAVGIAVVIVITLVLSKTGLGFFKKNRGLSFEKLVDNTVLYFIKQEISTTDMSIYPEYTNIITSMSSALEAPKNMKNQGR